MIFMKFMGGPCLPGVFFLSEDLRNIKSNNYWYVLNKHHDKG